MAHKVGLGIGHGENTYEVTGGKGINGWEEFWFNEAVGKHAYYRLKEHGFEVVLPQKWDENERSLSYKSNMFNDENTELNVCIHANAGPVDAKGACIFYWPTGKGEHFADIWIKNFNELCPEQGFHGDGKHEVIVGTWTNFHMVRETKAVTDLIEHGFFTNPEQLENLKDPDFQKRAAEAIVKSVCQYFGVKYKQETAEGVFYRVVTGSFKSKDNADQRVNSLKEAGFDSFIDVYKA